MKNSSSCSHGLLMIQGLFALIMQCSLAVPANGSCKLPIVMYEKRKRLNCIHVIIVHVHYKHEYSIALDIVHRLRFLKEMF
jgi:hypothetical protein